MGRVEQRRYLLEANAESGHGKTRRLSSSSLKTLVLVLTCWLQLFMLYLLVRIEIGWKTFQKRYVAKNLVGEAKEKEVAK